MLAIDHIVIAAKNPEKAANEFGKEYGLTITEGGQHANWGTYNYLAYFHNDCYIEWIGIFDETTAARSDNPLIHLLFRELAEGHEGPIQYALRTNRMDDYTNNLKTLNIPFTGPISGNRKRPDGSLLEWRMLFPKAEAEVLPFLIEWGEEKNTPQDSSLINDRDIHTLSASITNPENFSSIYQLDFNSQTAQLENADLKLSDELRFSIESNV
ncbi:Glyoxalase-like domain-containing protein [Lentibacillus halodurans]|uniref:Glyoxalase-like domain-containing protein n=1 Tax=Lentibacillus halodurans TaxID=237679 RepID=A0A1I0XU36_9BACI|nr:VOC family protein [Lentibacillus halodurans]SFB04424.1 Glyoxalase-like domain-containing protein [Lentibacillus halodurans]